jgi:hypothetical protein
MAESDAVACTPRMGSSKCADDEAGQPARQFMKIDVHTHYMPRHVPDFRSKFGWVRRRPHEVSSLMCVSGFS